MIVTRKSLLTGKVHRMNLPITQEQFDRYAITQELIQDAFPDLNPDQREFLMSGITPEEWDVYIKGIPE